MNFHLIDKSYEVNFIMLVCIGLLTFVRSIQTNLTKKTRLSLQLSAFVCIIASMHYFLMIKNKANITLYRYFDWFFTTPILLFDLCLILGITKDINFIIEIITYNTLMLLFGFMGELGILDMWTSTILGFIPFVLLFYKLYYKMQQKIQSENTKNAQNKMKKTLFNIFIILWSLYGLNHLYKNTEYKNGIYNILDLLTKGIFALFIYKLSWMKTV